MNKDLKDRKFKIPEGLYNDLKGIKEKFDGSVDTAGYKRLSDLLDGDRVSYQQMKRIKNYFDNYDGDKSDDEYKLNGGDRMQKWVDNALKVAREAIKNVKRAKKDAGMENAYIKTHTKDQNANPTKVRTPKIHKSSKGRDIYNDEVTYEETRKRIVNLMEKLDKK